MEGERRALALEPNSVEAGAGLVVNLAQRRELAQAYRQAQDLIRRRPDSARAHFASSYVLRYAGLLDEAANECETSFVLDAQTGWVRACAVAFMLKGDYARAVDYIHTDYGSQWAQALTIDTLLRQGKQKEALETRLPSIPQWGGYDMLLAFMQHKPASEVAALAGAVKSEDDPEVNYFSAAHLAYSGQTSAALDMLKRAIDGGYCSYPALDSDPFLASLRDKPEFREMRSAAMACQKTFLAQRGQRTRGE